MPKLPTRGDVVEGVYIGVPFTGEVLTARFHTINPELYLVTVKCHEPYPIVFGSAREGLHFEMDVGPSSGSAVRDIRVIGQAN